MEYIALTFFSFRFIANMRCRKNAVQLKRMQSCQLVLVISRKHEKTYSRRSFEKVISFVVDKYHKIY